MPVDRNVALRTIEAIEKMAQFQSNLAYIRNPPDDYDNPPVDVLGGLADIRSKVSEYSSQYEFEAEIASLLNSARDGHLGFDGPTFAGAVRWRRSFVLTSLSLDGGPAKIYDLGRVVLHFRPTVDFSRVDGLTQNVSALSASWVSVSYKPSRVYNKDRPPSPVKLDFAEPRTWFNPAGTFSRYSFAYWHHF